jgi:septum formation protein
MSEGANPKAVALALAEAKAVNQPADPEALVIGADQTLQIEDRLFDKTKTVQDVRDRLISLRGNAFELHSALAGACDHKVVWRYEETSRLRVRDFSDDFLDRYLERNGNALATSLAGFVLEGEGVQLFDQIDGDYFSILGLPLLPLLNWLRMAGGLVS